MVVTFTRDDLAMLIALAAGLNPERYESTGAKAMIYRCKSVSEKSKARESLTIRVDINS